MRNGFADTTTQDAKRWLRRRRHDATRIVGLALVLALTGCPTSMPGMGGGTSGPIIDEGSKSNDTFESAVPVTVDASGLARLRGTISRATDKDVFLIGRLDAGTMLTADAATMNSSLDVAVSFFDADQNLLFTNDDRGGSSRPLDSFALWTTRHASDAYYVVVAASALADPSTLIGNYTVDLEVVPGETVPPPVPQTLLLDFSGALVDSPVLGRKQLAAFDAAAISSVYSGQSDLMKQAIVNAVKENFSGLNVVIVSSDDGITLPDDTTSTVFIGDFDDRVFGLAENVDIYNFDRCDDAIIYSESFDPAFVFSFTPTVDEMGLAIGNIVSHEAGHLLGLFHVSDDTALMDAASPADAFVADQDFKRAPLSGDVVDLGSQDAAALLLEIVGPG